MKYKVLRMVKRRAGESREEFAKRWLAEHPKTAVVTLATGEIALGGAEAPFDGMSATYFPTERVVAGPEGAQALDPKRPQKALLAIGEQFLTLTREEDVLGKFRSVYGAAGAQPEACRAFYRQGSDRLIRDLAAYLRRADAAGTLKVRNPRQAADLFLSMFLGDGHIRGLLMVDMPDARENRALLREAVRVFMAAYAKAA